MDKGKVLLISLALGLMFMAFLDFKIPVHISIGITLFVALLTLHDFIIIFKTEKQEIRDNVKWWEIILYYSGFVIFYAAKVLSFFVELLYVLSIPISVYAAYIVSSKFTVEELNGFQQSLTLYTLGIVIMILGLTKYRTQQ